MKKGMNLTSLHSNEQILSEEVENIVSKPGKKTKASTPRKSAAKAHQGQWTETRLRDDSTTKPNVQSQSASMQSLKLHETIDAKDDLDASSKNKVSSHDNKTFNNPSPPAPKKIHMDAYHSQPKMQAEVQVPQPGAQL